MLNNKSLFVLITTGALTFSSSTFAYPAELTGEQLKSYLLNRLYQITAPSINDSKAAHEINQITQTALDTVRRSNMCYEISEVAKLFGFKGECTYTVEYVETALRTAFLEHVKQRASAYGKSVGENVAMVCDSIFRDNPRVPNGSMRNFIGYRFDRYIEEENNKHAQYAYSERPKPAPAYAPTTTGYSTPAQTYAAPKPSNTSTSYYPTTSSQPSTGSSAGGGAPSYSSTTPSKPSASEMEDILIKQATHYINNEGKNDNCPICLEPFKGSPSVGYPMCQHGAHVECAQPYIFNDKPCASDLCNKKTSQEKLEKNPHCGCGRKLEPSLCPECRRPFDRKKMAIIFEALKTQQR